VVEVIPLAADIHLVSTDWDEPRPRLATKAGTQHACDERSLGLRLGLVPPHLVGHFLLDRQLPPNRRFG
jgi:hypothetical protein